MKKARFDTSVYVRAWRERDKRILSARTWQGAIVYLSAVVGSGLLRGGHDRSTRRDIHSLWTSFASIRLLSVPNREVWRDAGIVLAKISLSYDYESIGQAKLVNDALIALSARQHGVTFVTLNRADFERIAEFRPFRILNP